MKLSGGRADFPDLHENGQKMVENRTIKVIRMVLRTIQKKIGADSGIFVGGIENLRRDRFDKKNDFLPF